MSLTIMQGDQYAIPFVGKLNGEPLDLTKIEQIEFVVGPLRKVYPGEVTTDEDGAFLFPLTQEETFAFKTSMLSGQVRVKFTGATKPEVIGLPTGFIRVLDSMSREVL